MRYHRPGRASRTRFRFRPPSFQPFLRVSLLYDARDRPVDFVLHPTDLSEASERTFNHALAIAIRLGAHFTLLHAIGRRDTDNWVDFPSVRARLAKWRAAGSLVGLEDRIRQSSIRKVEVEIRDPVAACLDYIERKPVNMVVLATTGRSGLSRLIMPPRAEKLARESKLFTLFVPEGVRGFVSPTTGRVSLRRILVPVDPETDPRPAMLQAVRAAELLDDPSLEITLLHVGDGETSTETNVPDLPFCKWNVVRRSGSVVEEILATADATKADAIYMSTSWRKARIRRTEGGVTERVLANASCPVATVPVERS